MNEIYWLTRLDALNTILIISFIVGCIVAFVTTIVILDMRGDYGHEDDDDNYVLAKKGFKIVFNSIFYYMLVVYINPNTKASINHLGRRRYY